MSLLQTAVQNTEESVGTLLDSGGDRARLDMQEATVQQLRKLLTMARHNHSGFTEHPDVRRVEQRLKLEERQLSQMQATRHNQETATLERQRSSAIPSSLVQGPSGPQRVWVSSLKPEPVKQAPTPQRQTPRASYDGVHGRPGFKKVTSEKYSDRSLNLPLNRQRRASMTSAESSRMSTERSLPAKAQVITQFDPEFYGYPANTPQWRVNIARAKRTFHLAFIGARAFQFRLKLKNRPVSKLQRVSSFRVHIPVVLGDDLRKFCKQQSAVIAKHDKGMAAPAPAPAPRGPGGSSGRPAPFRPPPPSVRPPNSSRSGYSSSAASVRDELTPSEAAELDNISDIVSVSDFEIPKEAMKNLQMMQMFVNRGNTRWTEGRSWKCGKAFDVDTFERVGGLDYNHYKLSAVELLKEGKVAFQVLDSDIMMALRDGGQLPLWLQDPWDAVEESLGEARLPLGDHFMGLTYASRLLLNLHIAMDAIAGPASLSKLRVVLHIPGGYADAIVDRIVADGFYGFRPENVIFVPQASFGGYCVDPKTNTFYQVEGSMRDSPGSGESMRQLMFHGEGFHASRDGKRIALEETVLEHLKHLGVEWLRSMAIDDIIGSHSDAVVDVSSLAMTLRLQATHGTGIVLQAAEVDSVEAARSNGNVVLSEDISPNEQSPRLPKGSPDSISNYSVQQVMLEDLRSLSWTQRLKQLKQEADDSPGSSLLTSAGRFFSQVPVLQAVLSERGLFHVSLALQGPYLYPKLSMCDITTSRAARTAALVGKVPLSRSVLHRGPFAEDLLPRLCQQDKWPLFKRMVGKYASGTVTITTRTSTGYKRLPRTYVVVVTDNEVSRDAFDFFCGAFSGRMSQEDSIHIVSTVKERDEEGDRQALLETFKDDMINMFNVRRVVLTRNGKSLVSCLEEYVEQLRPDLVCFGSDGLLNPRENVLVLGSVGLTLVRQLPFPLLVVKPSRACQLRRNVEGISEPIRVMFQADPTAQQTLEYMTTMLDKGRGDSFWFAKPWGLDATGAETLSSKSTLGFFTEMCKDMGFHGFRKPLEGSAVSHITEAAEREHSHIIALHTGKSKSLNDSVRDILMKAMCAVLVHKI